MSDQASILSRSALPIIGLATGAAAATAEENAFAGAKVLHALPWNSDVITSVAFIGDDQVAAGNKRGDILIWRLPTESGAAGTPASAPANTAKDSSTTPAPASKPLLPIKRLRGHTNEINRILCSSDGKMLFSVSNDRSIKCWDTRSDAGEAGAIVLNDGFARAGVVEKVDKLPAAPPPLEAQVLVQKPVRELAGHKEWVMGLALTPDGQTLVTGDDQGVVIVWDVPAGKERRRWRAKNWIRALDVSPDGKTVVTAEHFPLLGDKGAIKPGVRFWNAVTGDMQADVSESLKLGCSVVRFSPDGTWLVVCQGNIDRERDSGKIVLIDPATGQKRRELTPAHLRGVTDAAFHPDGKHLFTAGRDQLVRAWRMDDGKHLRDFGKAKDLGDWITALSIAPNGRLLAAADMAGQVVVHALTG